MTISVWPAQNALDARLLNYISHVLLAVCHCVRCLDIGVVVFNKDDND